MTLAITPWYALGLVALFLLLSVRVIVYRRNKRISLGLGDDPVMERRVRAQANFAEYAPLGLLLLTIAEVNDVGPF